MSWRTYGMPLMALVLTSACRGPDERIDAALRMQQDTIAVLVGAGDRADSYSWEFVPVPGNRFNDRGESPCRPNHADD